MSIINTFEYKKNKKRAEELKPFLLKLDSICDFLYHNLKYDGVFDAIHKLEDVRIKYGVEYYECAKIVEIKDRLKGRK